MQKNVPNNVFLLTTDLGKYTIEFIMQKYVPIMSQKRIGQYTCNVGVIRYIKEYMHQK
jgi:glutaredoxin 2